MCQKINPGLLYSYVQKAKTQTLMETRKVVPIGYGDRLVACEYDITASEKKIPQQGQVVFQKKSVSYPETYYE